MISYYNWYIPEIMSLHGTKIALSLKYAVITCYIFFQYTFDGIEQKTGVKANTACKIIQKAIAQVDYKDFH